MKKKVVPKAKRVKRLKKACDRLLQDVCRAKQKQCESCGKPAVVGHHHCPCSRSSNLRYDWSNIVLLCQGCHFLHHNGDSEISFKYRAGNDEWEEDLHSRQHIYKKWLEVELRELKQQLSDELKRLQLTDIIN